MFPGIIEATELMFLDIIVPIPITLFAIIIVILETAILLLGEPGRTIIGTTPQAVITELLLVGGFLALEAKMIF